MTAARKLKVSVTLSAEVLALVDRDAERRNDTRSGVVEDWLRRAAAAGAKADLDRDTAAYYRSLGDDERAEDEALARAASSAARRVTYEAPRRSPTRAPKARRR